MIITRDGKEIELTEREIIDAFYEQQLKFDAKYISTDLISYFNEDGSYTEMEDKLKNDSVLREKVAAKYRKYLEEQYTVDDEFNCLIDAYDYMTKW